MAPQNGGFGPGSGLDPGDGSGPGPFGNPAFAPSSAPSSTPASSSSTSSTHQLNVPLLSLGLAIAAFLLVCISVCACAYRRAKARNRTTRHLNTEDGSVEYMGLGIESAAPTTYLKAEDKDAESDHPPPAYSSIKPKSVRRSSTPADLNLASNAMPGILLSPSPALAAAPSPAFSTMSLSPALSPALSQREAEGARLLTAPPTPPPPSYARF